MWQIKICHIGQYYAVPSYIFENKFSNFSKLNVSPNDTVNFKRNMDSVHIKRKKENVFANTIYSKSDSVRMNPMYKYPLTTFLASCSNGRYTNFVLFYFHCCLAELESCTSDPSL